ncbi:MAG: cobalamin biosynthesis protein [Methanothrix sp.]|nr:MAG: cobalamin biosynthesis protein [Methanothrix sp.]
MDKSIRNLTIGLIIFVILTPLGLLATGETFGEWGNDELAEKIGYVPPGLDELSSIWDAPMPDYAFPGDESTSGAVIVYFLSAIIGVVIGGGVLYILGMRVAKNS